LSLTEKLLYNNTQIQNIGLNFVLPGYYNIELLDHGDDIIVTAHNLEEYVNLIFDALCCKGIEDSIDAFVKGFNIVFPITSLNCFTSQEIEFILCGSSEENWDFHSLYESIITNHGYDKNR
jgi:E3 ubiquitin-protein ligase TRIP12